MEPKRADKCHENDYTEQCAKHQAYGTDSYKLVRSYLVKHMWITLLSLLTGIILAIAGIVASLNANEHRSIAIWITYLGTAIALVVPFEIWDDAKPKEHKASARQPDQRAWLVLDAIVGTRR